MTRRRSHPTDLELIRYLEGEVTQSRAGQIIVLAQSSAAERKRLEAMEDLLDLVATPDERIEEIDLVGAVREQIARGAPPPQPMSRHRKLVAAGVVVVAALALISSPLFFSHPEEPRAVQPSTPSAPRNLPNDLDPEARRQNLERHILSWLDLERS